MKKELKQQIKQDELRTGYEHASAWAVAHRDEVRVTAIVVAVVLLAAVGFASYRSHQQASAERAFDEALTIFHAPVAGQPDATGASGTVYPTVAERDQKAAAAFAEVSKRYGSSSTGRRARYYAALANLEAGKTAEAESELKELSGKGDDPLIRDLSRLAFADLSRGSGRYDQALEAYRKIADDANSTVPRDHALMRIGGTLEDAKREAEALQAYRRILDEFPSSVYGSDARTRIQYLGGRG
jgi:predicted negative regulator of RcsB-dependent stress response